MELLTSSHAAQWLGDLWEDHLMAAGALPCMQTLTATSETAKTQESICYQEHLASRQRWAGSDFQGTNADSVGQLRDPSPPPGTHTHPLTKLSEVPPDLAAVRFLASLIQTWSSPPSPALPGKNPTQQEFINLNFHHC